MFDGTRSQRECLTRTAHTVNSLQMINTAGALTLLSDLTITNGGQMSSGEIWQDGGDLYLNGGFFSWRGGDINTSAVLQTLHIASGASMNVQMNGGTANLGDNLDNSGTIEVDSSSLNFTNNAGISNDSTGQILLDRGGFYTTGTGEIRNSGLVEKTRLDPTVFVDVALPIGNVSSSAVLWVQAGDMHVLRTSGTYNCSVYQASGTVELGSISDVGSAEAGTLLVNNQFIMNGGVLKTISSLTSVIDGDVLIHQGDVWIGVDGGDPTATLSLSNGAKSFTMDGGTYHCTVDGSTQTADLISVNGRALVGGNAQIVVNTMNPGGLQAGDSVTVLTAFGGVNANSNFHCNDPVWVAPTLNDGRNLELVYAP